MAPIDGGIRMRLPPLVFALGYAGLIPFVADPLWLSVAPGSAPPWLDRVWLVYAGLIASFMAGSFWGMALIVVEGPAGKLGMAMSAGLMLLAWAALMLPFRAALIGLSGVYALLVLAEIWRERTIDPLSGYFTLRASLTAGVLLTIAWRLLLHPAPR
jgi:hypothetical protein